MKSDNSYLTIESTTLWDFPRQNYGNKPHGNRDGYKTNFDVK